MRDEPISRCLRQLALGDLMSLRDQLRAAGARTDGLAWDGHGKLIFVATRAGGAWSEEEKRKACQVLGRPASPVPTNGSSSSRGDFV